MRRLKRKAEETTTVANDVGEGPPLPEEPTPEATALLREMEDAADRKVAQASIPDLEEISDPAGSPRLVRVGRGMERMMASTFVEETTLPAVYETTKRWLQAVDPGHAMAALNEGESVWHELSRAVAGAKLEKLRWEIDNRVAFGALWEDATKELQAEKDAGKRNKTITDKDVEARCATLFPDAWRFQEMEKERVHRTVNVLEQMLEQVASRVRTLTAIVNKGR